ncbi:6-O-methylguanine DNA methyltransferase, DNA binding domain containing protein, putative [Angomonas deanei]|uniref:Methylated-DNA--protein-cysteine methyltransferase n=1 Tax=Angomonas deanei TaxID=59799 RepID=A0A7G2CN40_9TRYP|nr:6-O-methylguanine DNA methyltransferase, DNA binding domain containing protein, putative [Angomonas deanei]
MIQKTLKAAKKAPVSAPQKSTKKTTTTAVRRSATLPTGLKLFHLQCPSPIGQFSVFFNAEGKVFACNWTEYIERMKEKVTKMWKLPPNGLALLSEKELDASQAQVAQKLRRDFMTPFEKYFEENDNVSARELESLLSEVQLSFPPSLPPFTRAVWEQCRAHVPAGSVTSYGALAKLTQKSLSQETKNSGLAARAVGAAMGSNPYVVVMPCHRVIGSTGGLHGYGCGLYRKVWLLRREKATGVAERDLKSMEAVKAIHTAEA